MKRLIIALSLCLLPLAWFSWQVSKSADTYEEIIDIDYLPKNYEITNKFNDVETEIIGLYQFRRSVSQDSKTLLLIDIDVDFGAIIRYLGKNKRGATLESEIHIPLENNRPILVCYSGSVKQIRMATLGCEKGEMEIIWKKSNVNYGLMVCWIIYWILLLRIIYI